MNINPVTIVLILIFLYPIINGLRRAYCATDAKGSIYSIEQDISFFLSLIAAYFFVRKIVLTHQDFLYNTLKPIIANNVFEYVMNNPEIQLICIFPIISILFYFIFNAIFRLLNYVVFYPVCDAIQFNLRNKSNIFKSIIGGLFNVPKAVLITLLCAFVINIISMINVLPRSANVYLESSNLYNGICKNIIIPLNKSKVAKNLTLVLDNSFKVVVDGNENQNSISTIYKNLSNNKNKTTVYYNGITLDEGIKSSDVIKNEAITITKGCKTDREKARKIYEWIGKNIEYDNNKAEKVLENDFSNRSGAIPTFETKKGICFDYSCLYVAMCREVGLKVRIVTGKGFNGLVWVSHAWNSVYLANENKWINVDNTFYKGGDYFDSKKFSADHREEEIIGEW
jgi:hypothetical protein